MQCEFNVRRAWEVLQFEYALCGGGGREILKCESLAKTTLGVSYVTCAFRCECVFCVSKRDEKQCCVFPDIGVPCVGCLCVCMCVCLVLDAMFVNVGLMDASFRRGNWVLYVKMLFRGLNIRSHADGMSRVWNIGGKQICWWSHLHHLCVPVSFVEYALGFFRNEKNFFPVRLDEKAGWVLDYFPVDGEIRSLSTFPSRMGDPPSKMLRFAE